MRHLTTLGRLLLSLAIAAFGVQHLLYAKTGSGLGPPWVPENHLLAAVAGILLIVAAAGLVTGRQSCAAALLLALVPFARGVAYYLPKIVASPRAPDPWTGAFELFAIAGTGCVLAQSLCRPGGARKWTLLLYLGRSLFAMSLAVFGVQHLLYGPFVAGLIPAWMPAHLFWAYFVGIAFLAAALAIASKVYAGWAATSLGAMFLLWVVMLHGPRVAAAHRNSDEWTSLLVALAMSGCSFAIAGMVSNGERGRRSV
ncbi:hypothetical protein [Granulicella arctica]|uniref:hypothetical protein n=1 Tax=Granulicella arctica TaxID=940613 RepID=UPI0021DF9842|nr:hypothetical protein [Granulicella arctica]